LTRNPLISDTNVDDWGKNINKSSEIIQNALFSFFTTFKVNFLRLVSDLKKGKWGKNTYMNRQQTVIEKYLHNKGKIPVIWYLFCRIKYFPHFTSWGSKLIVSCLHGGKWGKNISNQTLV
jgi:hypothetical protein